MAQCTAKSKRSKNQCKNWALHGRNTCRMHGGKSRGPRTEAGKERSRLAVVRYGEFTKKAKAERKEIRKMIRHIKDFIRIV